MDLEENEYFSLFKYTNHEKPNKLIITFPTSNGKKYDLYNYKVLDCILQENVLFMYVQTKDFVCFYDPKINDEEKANNLLNFLVNIENKIYTVIQK